MTVRKIHSGPTTLCKVPSDFATFLKDIDSGDEKIDEIFEFLKSLVCPNGQTLARGILVFTASGNCSKNVDYLKFSTNYNQFSPKFSRIFIPESIQALSHLLNF